MGPLAAQFHRGIVLPPSNCKKEVAFFAIQQVALLMNCGQSTDLENIFATKASGDLASEVAEFCVT
jgi:hypothetical protein